MLNKILMGVVIALLIVALIPPILTHQHRFDWEIVTPATCTEAGKERGICECGKETSREIGILSHLYSKWTVSQQPTCTQQGKQIRSCTICGKLDFEFIDIIPHQFAGWSDYVLATCTEDGQQIRSCTECGFQQSRDVLAHHTFVDNQSCALCGVEYYSEGLVYFLDDTNNGYILWGIGTCDHKNIVIPKSIDGYDVIAIRDSAFKDTNITSVTIPSTVKVIGNYAFASCYFLEEVIFADGSQLTEIGTAAFRHCTTLTAITLPDTVTTVHSELFRLCKKLQYANIPRSLNVVGYSMFSGCESLLSITIHSEVTRIEDYAFLSCRSLETVVFEENSQLLTICHRAFNSTAIKEITIPASVTTIEQDAFGYCTKLVSVIFEDPYGWSAHYDVQHANINVSDPTKNPYYLTTIYPDFTWTKN